MISTENFIRKAKLVHGDKYDYSRVKYDGCHTKICIICPIHGEFWQTPNCHNNREHGCPQCGKIASNKDNIIRVEQCSIDFSDKAKSVHGDKYDYSKVKYIKSSEKVCIICPIHGEFWQEPNCHLNGKGCSKCNINKIGNNTKPTTEEFIEKAKSVHGDKYDYSKVNYVDKEAKVCIICPKHGEYHQSPNKHLMKQGCPICNESKLEIEVAKLLDENNITYERQKHFKWLGRQSLDFYLPEYQIGIECQGEQHFKPIKYWGGNEKLLYIKNLDKLKYNKCIQNNVKLIYFMHNKMDDAKKYYSDIYTNNNNLLSNIIK